MGLEDEVRRLADKLGISDPAKIKELEEALKKLAGGASAEDLAQKLGEILGRVAKGTAMGATGVPLDPDLIKKLIDLLGPSIGDIIGRLMKKMFGDGSGYKLGYPGPSPYKRERLRDPARDTADLVDDQAPEIYLNGTPEIECLDNDRIRITGTVTVVQREEDIYKVNLIANGITGATCSEFIRIRGQKPIENPKDDTPIDVKFELIVKCSEAVQNLGIIILTLMVEDEDGNQMIDFIEVDLLSHLLNDEENCCKTFKRDEIRRALLDALLKRIRGLTGKDIENLIKLLTQPRETPTPTPTPPALQPPATGDGAKKPPAEKRQPVLRLEIPESGVAGFGTTRVLDIPIAAELFTREIGPAD